MKAALTRAPDWQKQAERQVRRILVAAQAVRGLPRPPRKMAWKVDIRLVDSSSMERLNWAYRAKRYPTDVLSFPAPEVFHAHGYLGDLVICLPTLKRQAREIGHDPLRELQILLVHGVLHLMGFDHEKSRPSAREMARREEQVLARLFEKAPRRRARVAQGLIKRSLLG